MINIGTKCIHTSKWEKRKCRVVAYDGDAIVVVKFERGGYAGVPEKSLTQITQQQKETIPLLPCHECRGTGWRKNLEVGPRDVCRSKMICPECQGDGKQK